MKEEMKKRKVYLSGPITGIPESEARDIFSRTETRLIEEGFNPVNPMRSSLAYETPWEAHMRRDISLLLGCDAIWLLPNFKQSKGAMLELSIAVALDMEIMIGKETREQIVEEYMATITNNAKEEMQKDLDAIINEPSRTLKKEPTLYTTTQRRSEFLDHFGENGWELYRTNTLFHHITNHIMRGASVHDILLDLTLKLEEISQIPHLITHGPYPTPHYETK